MPRNAFGRSHKATVLIVLLSLTLASGCGLPGRAPVTLPPPTLPAASATPTTAATATATEPPASTPTATLLPTETSTSTETSTPAPLKPAVVKDTLCYRGPGNDWGVVSSLKADTNVVLLGKGALPGWWVVLNPTYNQPCWVADAHLKIDPAYDATALKVYAVPPRPANLVPSDLALNPSPPVCMEQFKISVNVTNKGTEPTARGGTVLAIDRRSSNKSQLASATGTFPTLSPGQTYTVKIKMTVSKWWGVKHQIVVTIDPDKVISESSHSDNTISTTYTLAQGSCP